MRRCRIDDDDTRMVGGDDNNGDNDHGGVVDDTDHCIDYCRRCRSIDYYGVGGGGGDDDDGDARDDPVGGALSAMALARGRAHRR